MADLRAALQHAVASHLAPPGCRARVLDGSEEQEGQDGQTCWAMVRALSEYERVPQYHETSPDVLARAIRDHAVHVIVVEEVGEREEGQPAAPQATGFAMVLDAYNALTGRMLILEQLFVDQTLRGRGVARFLLRCICSLAKPDEESGGLRITRMQFLVLDWNAKAHGFYETLGARPMKGLSAWGMDAEHMRAYACASSDMAEVEAKAESDVETETGTTKTTITEQGAEEVLAQESTQALDAVALRHQLHRVAEVSGHEEVTARTLASLFKTHPAFRDRVRVTTGVGGQGLLVQLLPAGTAATVSADASNSTMTTTTTLLRAELDALPIAEGDLTPAEYASTNPGVSHKCGHDGHMAAVVCAAHRLVTCDRLVGTTQRQQVFLLFQPAEETGKGAASVLEDEAFRRVLPRIDRCFAFHNLPGLPLGTVAVRSGVTTAASCGVTIRLQGQPSHAAEPANFIHSPAAGMSTLLEQIGQLGPGATAGSTAFATVVHAQLGGTVQPAFGTCPGMATVSATLRAFDDNDLAALVDKVRALVQAQEDAIPDITHSIEFFDEFTTTVNNDAGVAAVRAACERASVPCQMLETSCPWSEDFGRLAAAASTATAFFVLGTGVHDAHGEPQAALHTTAYDFPDELVAIGANVFAELVCAL